MVERRLVGPVLRYRGHEIEARLLGPDLLCYVDGQQVGEYWLTAQAAHNAGQRHVDTIEDEKEALGKKGASR